MGGLWVGVVLTHAGLLAMGGAENSIGGVEEPERELGLARARGPLIAVARPGVGTAMQVH